MNVEKPKIGSGLVYFGVAGSLIVLGLVTVLLDFGDGRDPRVFASAVFGLAVAAAAVGFFVRLFGLVERQLIEIQAAMQPADLRPMSGPPPAPVGVDRYGLPLRRPEIGLSGASGDTAG